ncbi:hypothetical protein MRX96_041635 [Rhipicephalus microplus]
MVVGCSCHQSWGSAPVSGFLPSALSPGNDGKRLRRRNRTAFPITDANPVRGVSASPPSLPFPIPTPLADDAVAAAARLLSLRLFLPAIYI